MARYAPPESSITLLAGCMWGLCNRLQAMDSTIHLARSTGYDADIIWCRNNLLNADFESLFELYENGDGRINLIDYPPGELDDIKSLSELIVEQTVYRTSTDPLGWRLRYRNDIKSTGEAFCHALPLELATNSRRIYITAYKYFHPDGCQTGYDWLRPIKALRQQIAATREKLGEHYVGVHIRRGINEKLHEVYQVPHREFVQHMQAEVDKHSEVKFFLATDNADEKRCLRQRFGARIFTRDIPIDRNSLQGMRDAVIDLYLLGYARSVIYQQASTFGATAADLTGSTKIALLPLPYTMPQKNLKFKSEIST